MIWLLLILAAVVIGVAIYLTDEKCLNCGRELEDHNYSGWASDKRRFCPYCNWREGQNESN